MNEVIQGRSDHMIPVPIKKIVNTKEDHVVIGRMKFTRVMTIGKLEKDSVICEDGLLKFNLYIDDTRLHVEKWMTNDNNLRQKFGLSTECTSVCDDRILSDDYINVVGKIRIDSDGKPFLNAFSIRKVCKYEFAAFVTTTGICEKYYQNNTTYVSNGTTNNESNHLNLGTLGLDRFPITMLESSSVSNNKHQWPADLPIDMGEEQTENVGGEDEVMDSDDSFDRPVPK